MSASRLTLSVFAPEPPARKTRTTQLRVPCGEPDIEAVTNVIRQWLVPLLVTEFMAEYKSGSIDSDPPGTKSTKKSPRKKS